MRRQRTTKRRTKRRVEDLGKPAPGSGVMKFAEPAKYPTFADAFKNGDVVVAGGHNYVIRKGILTRPD